MPQPEYACAVIEDRDRRLLLELRPATSRHAANQLTCFGGKREAQEDAAVCLRRELHEELAWAPAAIEPACDLWQATRWIARFFRCQWAGETLRTEPGHAAIWVPWSSLHGLPLSPWHAQVLDHIAHGRARCELT